MTHLQPFSNEYANAQTTEMMRQTRLEFVINAETNAVTQLDLLVFVFVTHTSNHERLPSIVQVTMFYQNDSRSYERIVVNSHNLQNIQ